jgi:hypothetical protein
MHAKHFCSEFLDIFKNDFKPAGAYAPMSQNGFPHVIRCKFIYLIDEVHLWVWSH